MADPAPATPKQPRQVKGISNEVWRMAINQAGRARLPIGQWIAELIRRADGVTILEPGREAPPSPPPAPPARKPILDADIAGLAAALAASTEARRERHEQPPADLVQQVERTAKAYAKATRSRPRKASTTAALPGTTSAKQIEGPKPV